jgi:hypothetical protein
MAVGKKYFWALTFLFCLLFSDGCTSYERQVVPFKMPESSPNALNLDGAAIAARSFITSSEAKEAFGFDIRSAGLLPMQVVFDNRSSHSSI